MLNKFIRVCNIEMNDAATDFAVCRGRVYFFAGYPNDIVGWSLCMQNFENIQILACGNF